MECNIIKDLIPLFIDDCCSAESAKAVNEHIEKCTDCKNTLEIMKSELHEACSEPIKTGTTRIKERKASVLQSVLLFVSFEIITIGVAKEAATPYGFCNGFWAFTLVVPATGFLLSLANWYFVRLYKSKKMFSDCSALITLLLSVCALAWTLKHYEYGLSTLSQLFNGAIKNDSISSIGPTGGWFGILYSIGLIFVLCVVSKIMSDLFAKMTGKE